MFGAANGLVVCLPDCVFRRHDMRVDEKLRFVSRRGERRDSKSVPSGILLLLYIFRCSVFFCSSSS